MSPRIETRRVEANGLSFEVDVCGDGDRLALCLHGFPELAFSWRHQLPALARLGYRAWAPNLRGYGRTARPPAVSDYRMPHLVADAAGLIGAAGARSAIVVGHDWGGAVAWHLALGHPRLVERLIVLNMPHPACLLEGLRGWRQRLRSWYVAAFRIPWLPERLLGAGRGWLAAEVMAATATDRSRFPPAVLQVYRDAAARPGALRAMVNYYRALPLAGPPPEAAAALRERIEIPTLMIWGEEDFALGRELLRGTRAFVPDLVLRTLPGISHWVQQEAPETVNELMGAWLTGRPVPVPGAGGRIAGGDAAAWCSEPPPALLLRGVEQFNRGEFFEQHETLEDLWRAETRAVRRLYQGILQIGVAAYQIRRRNHHGAMHMLTRGPAYLRPFAPRCQSVDVADLLAQAARMRAEVERLGPDGLARFDWSLAPRVRLIDTA